MSLKNLYLLAAVLGAIISIVFYANFVAAQGIDLVAFVQALFVNGATGGFTADLLISSFVFWIYMFSQRARGPQPWLFIALNLGIGLSCALPGYLYARERAKGIV
ncbi:MAG: DUF2834 domain-containing protein [Gammaproteobacteria bacterium]|nr:DUF2834 domain-containing protein [Gammaproteobacteria bacterium]